VEIRYCWTTIFYLHQAAGTFFCGGSAYGTILISFFLSSSRITKYKYRAKLNRLHDDKKQGGSRRWSYVLSSSITALAIAVCHYLMFGVHKPIVLGSKFKLQTSLLCAYIGHYACCTGDTWASELGALEKAMPVLITKCKRVPPGTHGAVSVTGTFASIAGGAFIGSVYYFMSSPTNRTEGPPQWPVILLGALAGFVGSLVDSILGSLFQYSGFLASRQIIVHKPDPEAKHISGFDILSNNQVNFIAALVSTVACGFIAPSFFEYWKYESTGS